MIIKVSTIEELRLGGCVAADELGPERLTRPYEETPGIVNLRLSGHRPLTSEMVVSKKMKLRKNQKLAIPTYG